MAMHVQKRSSVRGKDKKRAALVIYVVLALILLAFVAGSVYARYVYSKAGNGAVRAGEFYFTSDYLTTNGESYTLNPGTESITFTLINRADELRIAADDIHYTITSTSGTLSSETGTLSGNTKSDAKITLSDLKAGETYTVTAIGEAGYKETLTATFEVLPAETSVYKNLDTTDSAYVLLTVWTEDVTGDAVITFPENLIPDNTDPVMAGVINYKDNGYSGETITDVTSFTTSYSSRTYRFFKEVTTERFTAAQFEVKIKDIEAITSTPR